MVTMPLHSGLHECYMEDSGLEDSSMWTDHTLPGQNFFAL